MNPVILLLRIYAKEIIMVVHTNLYTRDVHYNIVYKTKYWRLMPIIPALWEAEVSRSLESRRQRLQ